MRHSPTPLLGPERCARCSGNEWEVRHLPGDEDLDVVGVEIGGREHKVGLAAVAGVDNVAGSICHYLIVTCSGLHASVVVRTELFEP
jgi:hypothetical protein